MASPGSVPARAEHLGAVSARKADRDHLHASEDVLGIGDSAMSAIDSVFPLLVLEETRTATAKTASSDELSSFFVGEFIPGGLYLAELEAPIRACDGSAGKESVTCYVTSGSSDGYWGTYTFAVSSSSNSGYVFPGRMMKVEGQAKSKYMVWVPAAGATIAEKNRGIYALAYMQNVTVGGEYEVTVRLKLRKLM